MRVQAFPDQLLTGEGKSWVDVDHRWWNLIRGVNTAHRTMWCARHKIGRNHWRPDLLLSRSTCYHHFMADLFPQVRRTIRRYDLLRDGMALVVGVSGGPDSLCLLHLLSRLTPEMGLRLHVAHLNHGLRGAEADADADFVAGFAAGLGVACTVGRADVAELAREAGLSLEEAARQARYRFLADVAADAGADAIAVGHNADDQAETVLMHFLRGSGVAGLRGMLPKTQLGEFRLSGEAGERGSGERGSWGVGERMRLPSPILPFPHSPFPPFSSVRCSLPRAPPSRPTAPSTASNRASTAATRTRPSIATGCATSCCRSWRATILGFERCWRTPPRCWPGITRCCARRWTRRGIG